MFKPKTLAWPGLILLLALIVACAGEPQTVIVTQQVISEVPVTIEVTRVVTQEVRIEVPREVPVEVTRLVEVQVLVTETAPPEIPAEVSPTATPLPPTTTPLPLATAVPVTGATYTVQPGDTLWSISTRTGVSVEAIRTANNLSTANTIVVGQQLIIPGWSGETAVAANPAPAQPQPPTQPVSANLLPNPSFEDDWYFFNNIQELQLPLNWLAEVYEGPNTLNPGSGASFFRPEIRLLTKAHLPANEADQFVFDGIKTIKAFKGNAPTNFAIYTQVALQPGTYRFTVNFFPDAVVAYDGGNKIWNLQPAAAEYRFIVNNGGSDWLVATVGTRNTVSYEFTINQAQTTRIGVGFRNRYEGSNNGWFLDDWSLVAVR